MARVFQIRRKAFLVAIDGVKKCRIAVQLKIGDIQLAAKIADVWPLNLDDPRAQIRQPQRCQWPSEKYGKIQDQQAFEGFGHGRESTPSPSTLGEGRGE